MPAIVSEYFLVWWTECIWAFFSMVVQSTDMKYCRKVGFVSNNLIYMLKALFVTFCSWNVDIHLLPLNPDLVGSGCSCTVFDCVLHRAKTSCNWLLLILLCIYSGSIHTVLLLYPAPTCTDGGPDRCTLYTVMVFSYQQFPQLAWTLQLHLCNSGRHLRQVVLVTFYTIHCCR